jgi:hypothetical protein
MLMTEEEASKRWCPMYRTAQLFNDMQDNRGACVGAAAAGACIASGCMMWREVSPLSGAYNENESKKHGYCGLVK